jgi:hypothetical protein
VKRRGLKIDADEVGEPLIADLKSHTGRVCPLECGRGEVAKGDVCVAVRPQRQKTIARERPEHRPEHAEPVASNPAPRPAAPSAPRAGATIMMGM